MIKEAAYLLARVPEKTRQKGFQYVLYNGMRYLLKTPKLYAMMLYAMMLMPSKSFSFNNKEYRYLYHIYNRTWSNERCVEIPIIQEFVNEYKGKNILEIGNVLSHYFNITHDVVDKYEKAPHVINCDIVDFEADKKYDLVVSISTLEHVGFDEPLKDPVKIINAISAIKRLLVVNGISIVTLPFGYNTSMDKLFTEGKISFNETYYLQRIAQNEWVEADSASVFAMQYGTPFPYANGLIVGLIRNI